MTVRVGVLDDHRSYGEALCLAMSTAEGFECVGVATSINDAVQLVSKLRPDVLIVDYQLASDDGFVAAQRVLQACPELRVIMLTAHASTDLASRARAMGIEQLLTKNAPLRTILTALAADEPAPSEATSNDATLSVRQREVLTLMGDGLDPARIAEELGVSIHTSRSHVKSVMKYFDAPTQLSAVTTAVRRGYIVPPLVDA